MERINKVLARSTDFSRREIDKFIMEGRIKVGEITDYTRNKSFFK